MEEEHAAIKQEANNIEQEANANNNQQENNEPVELWLR